jgi:hypothetical protein
MLVLVVVLDAVVLCVRLLPVSEKSFDGVNTSPSILTTVPDLITCVVPGAIVKMGV